MKKICKYCHYKIPKKELKAHIRGHEEQIEYVTSFKNLAFKCLDGCKAPCCKNFPVLLSAGDMTRISKFLHISKENLITNNCKFTVFDVDFNSKILKCGFQLTPPCNFFKNNLCEINEVKPLSCRTFPEGDFLYLKLKAENQFSEDETMEWNIASNRKNPEFLCFKKSYEFDEDNWKYHTYFLLVRSTEQHRTGELLKIQNKTIFDSLMEALQETGPEVLDNNGSIIHFMEDTGINDEIWNEFKDYFLDIINGFETQENICLI